MSGFFNRFVRTNETITDTIRSLFDAQRFFIANNGSVETNSEPAFQIDDNRVAIGNFGDIDSVNTEAAVDVTGEDVRIFNARRSEITSDNVAIDVTGSARIANSGLIDGDLTGVDFSGEDAGGSLFNRGTVSSDSRAVNIDGNDVAVRNFGDIEGTGDQRNGTVYANDTAFDYLVLNGVRGSIDAGVGNQGAGVSLSLSTEKDVDATVSNSGDIAGRGNAAAGSAAAGDGVRIETVRDGGQLGANSGTFVGDINNSGSITSDGENGTVAGFRTVNGVDFQGSLINQRGGEISGTQNGVYFGLGDHEGGRFINRGTVSSDSRALNIDGEDLRILNFGDIIGTANQRNGTVYADSTADGFTLINTRRGDIDAGEGNLGAGFSAELSDDGNNFDIINRGDIAGRGNASAGSAGAGDGIRLERSRVDGNLDGSTTGVFTGEIRNSGDITSEGANGTVAGFRAVNGVSFQGTLTNGRNGEISGTQNTGGVLNNRGLISSDSRALNIDGTGIEVRNSGLIIGTDDQRNGTVYADSTAQDFKLNNLRRGVIDAGEGNLGAGFSVELDEAGNNFSIDNNGDILGRGNAGAGLASAGDGIRLERTRVDGALDGTTTGVFTGSITNSGDIISEGANGTVAGFRAVNGVSFQGTLINERGGEISGIQNGVYFGNPTPAGGGDHTGGIFVNAGTVTSGSRALNIDGNGLAVLNTGSILGTDVQRNGTVYTDATANNYVFVNANSGVVDAGAGNIGSGVSLQIGASVQSIILNDGLFQGRGDADAANQIGHGLRLFPGADGPAFEGLILNTGRIIGSTDSAEAAGVSIEGVGVTGILANFGVIAGVEAGIDASTANGVNIVNGGLIDGDVVLSAEGDIFVLVAGGSIDGIVDAGDGVDTLALVGFSQAEVDALLASDQFTGFENILSGKDAFTFNETLLASQNDASFEEKISALAENSDVFTQADLQPTVDSIFGSLEDSSASDFLF